MNLYQTVADLIDQRVAFALCTVVESVGSSPRKTGAGMIVFPDGRTLDTVGGGAFEALVITLAKTAIAETLPLLKRIDLADCGMVCGGTHSVYIEPHAAAPALWLFGGGHCAEALYRVAAPCGFRVQVVEDRKDLLSDKRFPGATFHAIEGELAPDTLPLRDGDFVVIMTRGHNLDLASLSAVLRSKATPAYVGMIGSRAKVRESFQKARASGIPAGALESVHAPIGLDTGGDTPAEIAVSIMAEILTVRHGATGKPMREVKPEFITPNL